MGQEGKGQADATCKISLAELMDTLQVSED